MGLAAPEEFVGAMGSGCECVLILQRKHEAQKASHLVSTPSTSGQAASYRGWLCREWLVESFCSGAISIDAISHSRLGVFQKGFDVGNPSKKSPKQVSKIQKINLVSELF